MSIVDRDSPRQLEKDMEADSLDLDDEEDAVPPMDFAVDITIDLDSTGAFEEEIEALRLERESDRILQRQSQSLVTALPIAANGAQAL
jgi:hypothetical protein